MGSNYSACNCSYHCTNNCSDDKKRPTSIRINSVYRIIQAIRICVMPENALAGGEEDIGGNEPADFGVIVPALEVVETCLLVIDISTVTEGIILSECGRK